MRKLTENYGAILIYDEVMTGFRVDLQCTQGLHGVKPDLTCLGKVVGGGMPLAAFGGRSDIMAKLAPLGPVYQAGTLSGNPVAVAAGLATLKIIREDDFFNRLSIQTKKLCDGLIQVAKETNTIFSAQSVGGMFGFYFSENIPQSFADVMNFDRTRFNAFFHGMLNKGIYLAPSAFEAGFVSAAHSDQDILDTLEAARSVFLEIK
jgi:glutamate-1-semialdehyde 2,1-aminomutase